MPANQAVSADKSNVLAIANSVYDIALNRAGLTFQASQQWEFPTGKKIADSGYPYLVVTCPDLFAYNEEGVPRGKEMIRMMGMREPSWDVEVYVISAYEAGNSLTWSTPLDTMATLEQTFAIYWGLQGTCATATVVEPRVRKIATNDGFDFMEAMLTVRAYEALLTTYN